MTLNETLEHFPEQFEWEALVKNEDRLSHTDKFLLCGMGGSHLAGSILKLYNPKLDLLTHRNYGLPQVPEYFLREGLILLSSFSGNTEEVLDAGKLALEEGLSLAAITSGGKLLSFAEENNIPHIVLPNPGIESRFALGFFTIALSKLISEDALSLLRPLSSLQPLSYKDEGERVAKKLTGKIPCIYASTENLGLAMMWKIKMNEGAKIPSFYNVLPELNHNEMAGFDYSVENKTISENIHFILLSDDKDHPKIKKRREVLESILDERRFPTTTLELSGENVFEKAFSSLLLCDWTTLALAENYNVPPDKNAIIEDFKKRI